MKRRWLSILAALALCLGLLPGTALAVDTGVEIVKGNIRVTLEAGKVYVADETNGGVKEVTEGEETPTDYLSYEGSTLTVHGAVAVTCNLNVYSDLTITGDAGSSLDVTGNGPAICLQKPITLTLDGGVDFTARGASTAAVQGPYSGGSCFASSESYSGRVVLGNTASFSTATSIQYAALDLQNSASIELTRWLNYSSVYPDLVLKSTGDITITDVSSSATPQPRLTVEGNNVTVKGTGSNPAYMSHLDITARGNVEISSGGIPVNTVAQQYYLASLTVKGAQSVSVTGASSDGNALFPFPVTFENCGSVTVTDTGNGEILKEGVPVTSDCPWTAAAGGKTVTIPSGEWHYGGELTPYGAHFIESDVTAPTAYRAGEGWAFYTPGDNDTDTPAKLTLDGASYNGEIIIHQAKSVQLELNGENEVKSVNTAAMTLTGNGSFQGTLATQDFTNHSTAALNAVVIVTVPREGTAGSSFIGQTVYGNRSTSDLSGGIGVVQENTPLTIADGATLTVPERGSVAILDLEGLTNHGTIINEGEITIAPTTEGTPNLGTIVNDGTIVIEVAKDSSGEGIPAFIKALNLTGSGSVVTQYWDTTTNTNVPVATYTHSGLKLLEPAGQNGTLDLSTASTADESHWNDQGYKWTDVQKDENDNITSGTLVLAEGFNAEKVVLPDAEVEIVSGGECTIGTLTPPELSPGNAHADKTKLTFSGAGPLTVQEFINISGGHENTLTVAQGAVVIAENGITICADGVVDGLVTVNGTLTAKNRDGAALRSGNVVVGGSGTLKVSGDTGVVLGGKRDQDFNGAFTIQSGGRLEANCTKNSVEANIGVPNATFEGYEAADILVIPDGYVPQGREPQFNGKKTSLFISGGGPFNISSDNVPPVHEHAWAEGWTTSETHHWHECAAAGCTVTEVSEKSGYGEHVYDDDRDEACNICGYTRSIPTPEPPADSGGRDDRGSSVSTYAVTVEKTEHGKVSSNRTSASGGSTVTLTVTPEEGYVLDALTVTDSRGNEVKLTEKGGRYTFTMPERAVTVRGVFAPLPEEEAQPCDGGAECPSRSFADLEQGAWYHEAVDYVLERGLMGGHGNGLFGPNDSLSRAQFAQILYNQAGQPAVTGNGSPFTDVAPGAWCAPAVAWAAEQGVVGGYGGGLFGPEDPITREQLAVMLWRYAGSPAAPDGELTFTDAEQIGAYAQEALRWAVQTGVMRGKGGGVLDPKGLATRAQTASMVRNFLENR